MVDKSKYDGLKRRAKAKIRQHQVAAVQASDKAQAAIAQGQQTAHQLAQEQRRVAALQQRNMQLEAEVQSMQARQAAADNTAAQNVHHFRGVLHTTEMMNILRASGYFF